MRRIARNLELSLAAHSPSGNDALRHDRECDLRQLGGAAQTIGLWLDGLAANHTNMATIILSGIARIASGASYIGNGAICSVYRKDNSVLKVHRPTVQMQEEERISYLHSRRERSLALLCHMGEMAIPQTFSIGVHPLGRYRAVIATQPFITGSPLRLFTMNAPDLDKGAVSSYCERQPHGQEQLHRLADSTFRSDETMGLVPDINGKDNLLLQGPSEHIALIDADPVSKNEHPTVRDLILRQAEALDRFLCAA